MKLSLRRLVFAFFSISIAILLVSRLPRNVRVIVEDRYQERVAVVLASQGESAWTSRSLAGGMGFYLYNLNTLNKVLDAIDQDSKRKGYHVDVSDNFLLRLVYTKRIRSLQ